MSLVLQSKKAFLHGEQLCKDATGVSAQCGQIAADVLALSAKVRWMTDAVREQLKVCAASSECDACSLPRGASLLPMWPK